MTREEYTSMDVEDYFNYMGMLAAEVILAIPDGSQYKRHVCVCHNFLFNLSELIKVKTFIVFIHITCTIIIAQHSKLALPCFVILYTLVLCRETMTGWKRC